MINFLNISICGGPFLFHLGEQGLRPVHYLFGGGRKVEVIGKHIRLSFSRTTFANDLRECQIWSLVWRTALAVTLLIPGLILGLCKVLTYFFTDLPTTVERINILDGKNIEEIHTAKLDNVMLYQEGGGIQDIKEIYISNWRWQP